MSFNFVLNIVSKRMGKMIRKASASKSHHGQIEPDAADMKRARRLRLQRFGMASATYVLVTVTALLTTYLGMGRITSLEWMLIIGIGLLNNVVFFLMLYTGMSLRFSDPSLTWTQIVFSAVWGLIIVHALPDIRPLVLMFYVPAFSFGMLRLSRREYLRAVGWVMGFYGGLLVFEYLQKRQGFEWRYELFVFCLFGILLTWFALFGGFISILQRKKAQDAQKELIHDLQNALAEVKTLSSLLPICSSCKKIRDDKGYWNQIESYISHHFKAKFSHSICPECAKKLYPEFDLSQEAQKSQKS